MNNNLTHCKGITTSGEPCKMKPGQSGYCHLHDPERKRQAEEVEQETRTELDHVRQEILNLESEKLLIKEYQKKHQLLTSVTEGLYIEIEKLTKKAPAEEITELALEQINDVIKDTKDLVKDDTYVQKLQVFVPAGDPPQLRDALIVLRQIKQGLERFAKALGNVDIDTRITEARRKESILELRL